MKRKRVFTKENAVKKSELRPVLVTTEYKGVFFGYCEGGVTKDGSITLKNARNCVYWSSDVRGFMGLAASGPTKDCRIGPAVTSITLVKVTAVVEVASNAVKAWEDAPWQA